MRTNRPYSLVALAVVVLLAASCGSDRIGTRYRAERALYKALRQEQNLRLDPARAPKVLEEYRRIVESIPLPAAESDTGYAYPIARLRSNAVNGMVKMHDRLGQSEKAQELLEQARKDYLWDPRIALRIYGDLIDRARARGDYGQVAGYCQEIAGSLPARDGHGRPTASPENGRVVLDSPLDAADALAQVGRRDEAFAELDRAEIYYRSVIDEAPDDQAAAVAWVDLGLTQLRRGHLEDAAASLDRAQRVPGAREMRARILFLMASLDEERKDYAGAANRLAELLDKEGKDPVAPRAAVKRAQMLARLDRQEEAIQLLETVKVNHPLQKDAQAEAELQAARIRAEQGRWNDAISYYIALQADFPTSPQALGAPFEIAAYYRSRSETQAANNTLERAIEKYDQIRGSRPGSQEARLAEEAAVQALAELQRWPEAADRLLGFAKRYPGHPGNVRAAINAAAILAGRMGERERAAGVLDEIAAQTSDSALAGRAREEAARLRSGGDIGGIGNP